jgi:hypothetical protein
LNQEKQKEALEKKQDKRAQAFIPPKETEERAAKKQMKNNFCFFSKKF